MPDFWRTEVFHPLSVHGPIALLGFGAVLWLAGAVRSGDTFFMRAGRLALAVGTALAWVAVYTGSLADGAVGRTLCDPTVAKTHEQWAWAVSATFTAAVVVDLGAPRLPLPGWLGRTLRWAVAAALIAASAGLVYAGHLGATLVYQQGAGVYQPSEACTEFE